MEKITFEEAKRILEKNLEEIKEEIRLAGIERSIDINKTFDALINGEK